MTKEEVRKMARQLILILAAIEAAGWMLIVLTWIKVIEGPLSIVLLVLGIFLVVACLVGTIWAALQLSKIKGGD